MALFSLDAPKIITKKRLSNFTKVETWACPVSHRGSVGLPRLTLF
jgi:hypothetical protein